MKNRDLAPIIPMVERRSRSINAGARTAGNQGKRTRLIINAYGVAPLAPTPKISHAAGPSHDFQTLNTTNLHEYFDQQNNPRIKKKSMKAADNLRPVQSMQRSRVRKFDTFLAGN